MTDIEFHPIADLFPLMQGNDFDELVEDIRDHGLLEPIWIYEDKILDGRNRWRACQAVGVEPETRLYEGDDPVGFAVSLNLTRRHLSESQRAMVSERLATMKRGGDRKSDQTANLQFDVTVAEAAKMMNVSERSIYHAKKVRSKGVPELIDKVEAGEIKVSTAEKVAELPAEQQRHILALNDKQIMQAAGRIRKNKHQVKKQELDIEKQRQAQQVRSSPSAPVVYQQDAIDFLNSQPDYDLLLTDPPYSTDVEDIEGFARGWLPLALNKMRSTGRAYVFIGAYPEELHAYLSVAMPEQVLVWTYRNTLGPSPNGRYKQNWQAVLYYQGEEAPPLDCPELNELFSVQDISAPDGRQFNRLHKWQKPSEIADRFIRHGSRENDLVIDPFCCTGTFLLSATKYGRNATGCDISENHLAIAIEQGCVSGQLCH